MAGVTFKQTAISLRDVIGGLFKPKYAQQNQTKWIKNLLADDGLFTQDDGALVAPYDAWEAGSGGTLTVDTEELKLTRTSSSAEYGAQQLSLEIGKTYTVTAYLKGGTQDPIFRIKDANIIGTSLVDFTSFVDGTYHFTFEALSSVNFVKLQISGGNGTAYFDNISVRESMPEKVQNGTFDSDVAWTKGTGWTITGDVAVGTAVASGINLMPTIYLLSDEGKTYKVLVDVIVTSGEVRLLVYDGATNLAEAVIITTSGSYTVTFIGSDTGEFVPYMSGGGTDFTGSVDNISVKEISYELPHNAEVQAVYSDGSRQTPVDAYNVFDDGFNKTVNFTDDAVLTQDIAIDYRNKL